MTSGTPDGPAWLGIGAQRSGTTWFSDLLVQHPEISYGRSGRKELHALNTSLIRDRSAVAEHYLREFRGVEGLPGEFTPAYLRMIWVPALAREVCRDDVLLIVLLRDPIERFASAMRLFLARPRRPRRRNESDWVRDKGIDATWGGMYATHLSAWLEVFPRERFMVLQYERVRADPRASLRAVWRELGLDEVELTGIDERSSSSVPESRWSIDTVVGLRQRLVDLYRPEVGRLVAEWGIDPSLWQDFAA